MRLYCFLAYARSHFLAACVLFELLGKLWLLVCTWHDVPCLDDRDRDGCRCYLMPYGLPSAIPITRTEWALHYLTGDPVEIPAGTMLRPQYPLADQDGWRGEWLCHTEDGKQLAMQGEKLRFYAPS